jgi:hypothetical protein
LLPLKTIFSSSIGFYIFLYAFKVWQA